jgi:hypothetical protein
MAETIYYKRKKNWDHGIKIKINRSLREIAEYTIKDYKHDISLLSSKDKIEIRRLKKKIRKIELLLSKI